MHTIPQTSLGRWRRRGDNMQLPSHTCNVYHYGNRDVHDTRSKGEFMSDLTDVPAERFNSPEHQEWLAKRKKQSPCDPMPIKPKRTAHRCPECNCAAGRHTNVCSHSKANRGCGAPCESPCTCADEEDRRYKAFGK